MRLCKSASQQLCGDFTHRPPYRKYERHVKSSSRPVHHDDVLPGGAETVDRLPHLPRLLFVRHAARSTGGRENGRALQEQQRGGDQHRLLQVRGEQK